MIRDTRKIDGMHAFTFIELIVVKAARKGAKRRKWRTALALCALLSVCTQRAKTQTAPLPDASSPEIVDAGSPRLFADYVKSLQKGTATSPALENARRVAQDVRVSGIAADAEFVYYTVPAISPVMRMDSTLPPDGQCMAPVGIIAAQDEYEPASFVIYPFKDMAGVTLTASDLKAADGTVFPKENLDLKVVKIWYQNGNSWFSYFADPGLVLVPELLLNDENLIRVDTQKRANYATLRNPNGSTREVWISEPRQIDVKFDAVNEPFADAESLQPVTLNAGGFKQIFVTAHVTADTKPGLFQGSIAVRSAPDKVVSIPVVLRVLPFKLPAPATNFDLNKPFVSWLMSAWPWVSPDHPAFMPMLRDLRRHNLLNPGSDVSHTMPPEQAKRMVDAMKEVGFDTSFMLHVPLPWVGGHNAIPLTLDQQMVIERSLKHWHSFFMEYFGHTHVAVCIGDEPGPGWITKTRPIWRSANRYGFKTMIAGRDMILDMAGYILDVCPVAGSPADREKADRWRDMGGEYAAFYANQHNGSENPAFCRRQHGLLGYLSNFSMVDNYQFAYGPWNDLAYDLYKPMVLAYPTSRGLVDTLAFEGFREGIDDIRYATRLRQLADEAIASGNLDRVYAGRQVRQWFALMDGSTVDLNQVRLEMVDRILRLMELARNNTTERSKS